MSGESKAPAAASGPAVADRDLLIQGVLDKLSSSPDAVVADSLELAAEKGFDHAALVGVIKSLAAEGYCAPPTVLKVKAYALTEEGEGVLANGSPEFKFFNGLPESGSTEQELVASGRLSAEVVKNGKKNAMQKRWCSFDKAEKKFMRSVPADQVKDVVQLQLAHVRETKGREDGFDGDEWPERKKGETYKALKKRKFVTLATTTSFGCARGPNYKEKFVKPVADLTKEMIEAKSWETANFKKYNFQSLGAPVNGGALHPLMKVRSEFRQVLLQMGFEEMPTNRFVESSFWNFDALFQPQQHPARDAHDTFFLTKPASALKIPQDYMSIVKDTHQTGGPVKGSIGYRYDWKEEEARKNVLRTHTTAISSQMLYRLGQACKDGKPFTPKKYFSVDRVFRNETMDATHLAEFHQVEGLVADRGLGIGDLKGIIHAFFLKIGISKLRFKPAFNPYTEPSMEIFGYQPQLKKWIEIGNSGIFRPEMVQPMGIPPDVRVIAWGLSLERPTMIKYNVKNIRWLFGHKCKIVKTKKSPICRFDDQSGL